jgi:tetratricopeptide (TPR) repeat protein
MSIRSGLSISGAIAGVFLAAGPVAADGLSDARVLWQTGKYAEAEEAFHAILLDKGAMPADRVKATIGLAETHASQGEIDQAVDVLKAELVSQPQAVDLAATLADLEFERGLWTEADALVEQALKADENQMRARWVKAKLHDSRGQAEEALAAWRWFIDYQNVHQAEVGKSADALLMVGQAAERYYRVKARGEQLSETLNEVINDLYEGSLRVDPRCWQGAWLQGRLFLSGYNERGALKELSRALRINPSAAEVLVTLGQADLQGYKLGAGRKRAEDALEINPHYAPAQILLADLNISDERFEDALSAARKAVAENPKSEEALGRLAAACRLLVDPLGAEAAEAAALAVNPRPATFYAALGERLSDRRKYPSAERAFLQSIAADPNDPDPQIGLGMLYMQIGREDEANDLFTAAFEADPFNVRALNMMKVLEHLASYSPIETEHYRVLVLPGQDAVLGKYLAEFLETEHPKLVKRFGFEPPGKTTIEILKDHQWFSGRTTGLPFIPTVGACTGKVVALASPRTTRKPFNWSRVMIHEVTHVITLQQTEFNIPHWYTEALAVESEATPRPQPWNKLLRERVPARKLLNLDTINLGFIRPKEPEDRQLAYCQAQLYAQYMLKRFGDDAVMKMLDAYRRGLTTDRAIRDCFNVEKADFEQGYLAFLDEVLKTIRTRVDEEEPLAFSKLEALVKQKPDDADLNAKMAYELFARRDLKGARPYADTALKIQENHPLGSYVKARLLTSIGDDEAALSLLRPALDETKPDERVIDLLAQLEMKAGNLEEAERLYELARKDDPSHSKWIAGLARVHLRQNDRGQLLADLARLAANDSDDLDVRKTLADYHLKDKHFDEAARWARECLYIQVDEPIFHVRLADALAGKGDNDAAVAEYRMALELKPKKTADIRIKLAKTLAAQGKTEEATQTVDEILKADPEHPEALELRESLQGKTPEPVEDRKK